jgi:hypothetical protein
MEKPRNKQLKLLFSYNKDYPFGTTKLLSFSRISESGYLSSLTCAYTGKLGVLASEHEPKLLILTTQIH